MKLIMFIRCIFKGHDYRYTVSQHGEAVIAKRMCAKCGYFQLKVDEGE